jgi:hypothetical protein
MSVTIAVYLAIPVSVAAQDFSVEIDRIQYDDASGLGVDYGFSTAPSNPAPDPHVIPSSAITAPTPVWSNSTFLWNIPLVHPVETELTGDSYRMSIPQLEPDNPEPWGLSALGLNLQGQGPPPSPASDEWTFEVRLKGFANVNQPQNLYEVSVGTGSSADDHTDLKVGGEWFSGTDQGTTYDKVLSLWLDVRVTSGGQEVYDWSSSPTGLGLLVFGLDPTTTQLDLKVSAIGGHDLSGHYRINSDSASDWVAVASHTLPDSLAPATGFVDQFPVVWMSADSPIDPPLLEGDANRDGVVSAGDYASVQANFGDTGDPGIPGDANLDGQVSAGDYSSVQANFGNVAAATPVPEPATLSLLAVGGVGMLLKRRERQ